MGWWRDGSSVSFTDLHNHMTMQGVNSARGSLERLGKPTEDHLARCLTGALNNGIVKSRVMCLHAHICSQQTDV